MPLETTTRPLTVPEKHFYASMKVHYQELYNKTKNPFHRQQLHNCNVILKNDSLPTLIPGIGYSIQDE